MSAPLAILLSTYNGERFLAEQLDSLLRQSQDDFIIIARDDGSADGSRAVLERYATRHPARFELLPDTDGNLGASGSFARLLEFALERTPDTAPPSGAGSGACSEPAPAYLMFCDQDDIWHNDKVERQMKLMRATEAGNASLPVLVHSDLEVVSSENRLIAPSFAAYQGLDIQRNGFIELAISNLVTGCTALINAALARRALPIPGEAIMHDWWLALAASAFGKLVYNSETHGALSPARRQHHRRQRPHAGETHAPGSLAQIACCWPESAPERCRPPSKRVSGATPPGAGRQAAPRTLALCAAPLALRPCPAHRLPQRLPLWPQTSGNAEYDLPADGRLAPRAMLPAPGRRAWNCQKSWEAAASSPHRTGMKPGVN